MPVNEISSRDYAITIQAMVTSGKVTQKLNVDVTYPPTPDIPLGTMGYDIGTNTMYYNRGGTWEPITEGTTGAIGPTGPTGSFAGSVLNFSMIKTTDLTVLPNVPTTLSGFTGSPHPYNILPGFDVNTGIFTNATANVANVSLSCDLTWKAGVSNLGERTARIVFIPNVPDPPFTIKETKTQADPNKYIETTQEMTMACVVNPGEAFKIEVEHTAPINLIISGGYSTSICGTNVN